MSKNINEIPVTEMTERVQELTRSADNTFAKIRGVVTDIYTREIPAKWDWNFLMTESSITTTAEYHAGNASITTGDTAVVGGGGAAFAAEMHGRKITFAGNPTNYDITAYTDSTGVTITPALQGDQNITNGAYSIFQPMYSLASNFDRFPKPGGVYRWSGGRKQVLPEIQYANYVNDYYNATASTPDRTRIFGTDTLGNNLLEMVPAPRDAKVYGYEYLKYVTPLFESTAGTISSIGETSNTITLTTYVDMIDVVTDGSCFFRVDQFGTGENSTWYRIISKVSNNQLIISGAFANTAVTAGASFTIAQAPMFPPRLHVGVLYGACRQLTIDQNDPNAEFYNAQYMQTLQDAKKIYVSRPYSQDVDGVFTDYRYRR